MMVEEAVAEIARPEAACTFVHRMNFGAEMGADGNVTFRVWAPEASTLQLELSSAGTLLPMQSISNGCHELTIPASHGTLYRFVLPSGLRVPDPASRYQPNDAGGPSMVVDPRRFQWRCTDWKGRSWDEAVLYELHIGTFTPEGTFSAARQRLPYLVSLGVTAVEIMAIGDFPGARGWGYDGVAMYAPDANYGTPDDLKALVDEAHALGLMVLLDVVYNHFGPEGNYLPQLFPDVCTNRYSTPWGAALNFDAQHSSKTREFIIQNALYWLEEFQMDGLRLDAVHAIIDASPVHVLDELAHRVREAAADRHVHLILESDDTVWHRLIRDTASMPLLSTAQWNHDAKELAHVALTPPSADGVPEMHRLGRALTEGFTSEPAKFGSGHDRVEAPVRIPPGGFVAFLQTHDLVGNRLRGERLSHLASMQVLRALSSVYLLLPQIPMLFMGEEWAASTPFPYFCDFSGDLADAVRKGRLDQFTTPQQREDTAFLATVPDPLDPQTFLSAKLHWHELAELEHAAMLDHYRGLLHTRQQKIVPLLRHLQDHNGSFVVTGERCMTVAWRTGGDAAQGSTLRLEMNLSAAAGAVLEEPAGESLWMEGEMLPNGRLGPWSVRWTLLR